MRYTKDSRHCPFFRPGVHQGRPLSPTVDMDPCKKRKGMHNVCPHLEHRDNFDRVSDASFLAHSSKTNCLYSFGQTESVMTERANMMGEPAYITYASHGQLCVSLCSRLHVLFSLALGAAARLFSSMHGSTETADWTRAAPLFCAIHTLAPPRRHKQCRTQHCFHTTHRAKASWSAIAAGRCALRIHDPLGCTPCTRVQE